MIQLMPFPLSLLLRRPTGFILPFVLVALLAPSVLVAQATSTTRLAPAEARRLAPAVQASRERANESDVLYDPNEAQRFRILREAMSPEQLSETEFRLRALEGFVDYDEEEDVFYGPGRTQVFYDKYFLEADKLIFDNRLQEVQAEGNVILRTTDKQAVEGAEIRADAIRYNFADGEGVGFNVEGDYSPLYFKSIPSKKLDDANIPQFQQVSQHESLFRETQFTTCDFKVPHYRVRAREVILFVQDRVFFRGATFYVMEVPVLYLPFYTRSLVDGSPWFVQLGYSSRTGARIRIGYEYEHMTKEPSLEDDDKYEERSFGEAQTFVDFLSKRGVGGGFNYRYRFEFEKHTGEFKIYGFEDFEREVSGSSSETDTVDGVDVDTDNETEEETTERSMIYWNHRSELSKQLYAQINVDWFSDPEIFYDILDNFVDSDFERSRVIQRQARGALTLLREAWVARLVFEVKDRIGIDRYGNFSDPSDNNSDFDFDPGEELEDSDSNSIDRSRWGRVTQREPHFTLATRYLPVRNWPLFLMTEFNAYRNLDKGINVVSTDDDAFVNGGEFYVQGLWQHKISERYTLLVKVGAGAGIADRQDDDLGLLVSELELEDSLVLLDDDGTFLVGTEEFNLDQIQETYAWADSSIRLNARISDSLSGFLEWKFRQTTNDFIGDFYARVGDVTSRGDLYNYKLDDHWVHANLTYNLIYPVLYAFANAGYNLKSESDRFPNEDIAFANTGLGWANRRGTLRANGSVGVNRRQLYHPSDIRSAEQDTLYASSDMSYNPVHGRWYTKVGVSHRQVLNNTAEDEDSEDFTLFSDEDTRTRVNWVYGRELGPKWDTELKVSWDQQISGFKEISWLLQRDLHDALAILRVRTKRSVEDAESRDDNTQEFDVTLGLKLKLPEQDLAFGPRDLKTAKQRERQPVSAN